MKSAILANLVVVLDGATPSIQTELEWEYLIRVARSSGVLPRIAVLLLAAAEKGEITLTDYALNHFIAAKRHGDLLAQQVRFETQELVNILHDKKYGNLVFLKGAAYILAGNKAGFGRIFSDIDLLVPSSLIGDVERKLQSYGWFSEHHNEYDQQYYRQWAHEIPPLRHSARATVLDVHHNIVPLISGKAPKIDLFTRNCVNLYSNANVLCPAAMVLHSAVHLFYQEEYGHGFRDLSDLHLMFVEFADDPQFRQDLIQLAVDTKFTAELALTCRYLHKVFNTPMPTKMLPDMQSFLPNIAKLALLDWIFLRVLLPHHSLCKPSGLSLANSLALLRGHWIKMPLFVLLKHTACKVYKGMMNLLAGRGVHVDNKNSRHL